MEGVMTSFLRLGPHLIHRVEFRQNLEKAFDDRAASRVAVVELDIVSQTLRGGEQCNMLGNQSQPAP